MPAFLVSMMTVSNLFGSRARTKAGADNKTVNRMARAFPRLLSLDGYFENEEYMPGVAGRA
jgi:hypothetical protein